MNLEIEYFKKKFYGKTKFKNLKYYLSMLFVSKENITHDLRKPLFIFFIKARDYNMK